MYHRGASTIIPEKALFVVNPDEVHACKSGGEEHSYLILSVQASAMQAIASQISGKMQAVPYFRNMLIDDFDLHSKISCFFFLLEEVGSELEKASVLHSLLSLMILRHAEAPPAIRRTGLHDRTIRRVCEFIREHYAKPLSLKQLSGEACLSPFYFQRLFLEKTGISPHDYLVQIRIRNAQQLLAKGSPITATAFDTGFVDQSHFTRSFKRFTGMTPGGYVAMVTPKSGTTNFQIIHQIGRCCY